MSDANALLSESLESNESSFTNSNTDLLLILNDMRVSRDGWIMKLI